MNRMFVVALFSLIVAPGVTAMGQDKKSDGRLAIKSDVMGEERVILVRTPPGYETGDQRYPVLYMTDGDAQLGHTASTIEFLSRNGRMPQMIVVAITNTDRTRDLTPTRVTPPGPAGKQLATSGGADKFLKFIETELIPQVEKTYRTQPYRIFAGHSFGGLLAVHAFATKNDLFNAYIAVSPSLQWDKEVTVNKTADFLKDRKDLKSALYFTMGNEGGGMLLAFNKTKELLTKQQLNGFAWDSALMDDEDHGTVVLRSHYMGLKKIFDGWQPGPKIVAGGADAVEEHFKKLSAKFNYTIVPPEQIMNQLGYQLLLGAKKSDEAIAVFISNVKRYPNSANVYDSLAEAYEKTGKLELAKSNYDRAVQLGNKNNDPNLALYRTNFERVADVLKKGGKTSEQK